MQITPITFFQPVKVTRENVNNKNKVNNKFQTPPDISFSGRGKKHSIIYPRRYLPEYYPSQDMITRTYDSFTGMRDKNYLLSVVKNAMSTSSKNPKSNFAIAMFDMDNFKSVNELLGYQTGDDFIKTISEKITDATKTNGVNAYRFGGEEFVVIFDKQSKDKQKSIVDQVIKAVNSDELIRSKADEYKQNALIKLQQYSEMHDKIDSIVPLRTKQSLLRELRDNLSSENAKNDPYLMETLDKTDSEIRNLYLGLIDERLQSEDEDQETKNRLKDVKYVLEKNGELSKSEEDELVEYLHSVYDRTFEIHQIKKWLNDFDRNGGFSMTGGVVSFRPETLKDKTALQVIDEAGEVLKSGKNQRKGQCYFRTVAS